MQATADSTVPHDANLELEARGHWALATLGEFANQGRSAGWLHGDPIPHLRSADAFLGIGESTASPMRRLAGSLGLSSIAVDVLWLLVCVELEPRIARAAQLVMSPGMTELDAQVLERIIMRGAVFDEDVLAELAQHGLIEVALDPRVPAYRRSVRAADRVVELARGRLALDRELSAIASLASALEVRQHTRHMTVTVPPEVTSTLAHDRGALVIVRGATGSGRATMLRQAASASGRGVLSVRTAGLAVERTALIRQVRAITRECRLHDVIPLLEGIEDLGERQDVVARELLERFPGPVLASTGQPVRWTVARTVVIVDAPLPAAAARAQLWRQAIPGATDEVIDACADRYNLAPGLLAHTAASAIAAAGAQAVTATHVHQAVRTQLDRRLQGLAQRVETRQTWDDLVLPVDQLDVLIELVARVRHRRLVLDQWGFADKVGRGTGLTTLLSGPPGTGKTMIAGLVAQELGLDLYQVDLSNIVSKYIGETEKQLAALFEAAESGHAVLLFDEADSLFARRTEVKSSNDRYANLEVNYLLQRLESFTGIAVLTTNHETAIDPAFMRRLAFHVRVPMPDDAHRSLIWRSLMPERAAAAGDLDFDALAGEFVMSGGYIRNAALRAAFIAAEEGQRITNVHLRRAARSEYEGMGKVAFDAAALA